MRGNVRHHWTCCCIHNNGCGFRMLHNILRFCTAKGTVNRHQNGTNLHQSKPDIEKFRAVGQHHTHAVASADTQAEESTRDPIDRGVKVSIGYDLVLKDQERFFGVLPDTTFQELSDVHKRLRHACLHVSHACVSCSNKVTQLQSGNLLLSLRCQRLGPDVRCGHDTGSRHRGCHQRGPTRRQRAGLQDGVRPPQSGHGRYGHDAYYDPLWAEFERLGVPLSSVRTLASPGIVAVATVRAPSMRCGQDADQRAKDMACATTPLSSGAAPPAACWRPACPRTRTAACSSWKPDRTSRTRSSCRLC